MNFTPVNLTQGFPAILHEWVFAQNCTCPSGTYCVRPKHYSKPVACLANNIPAHLFNNLLANPAEFVEKSGQDFLPILLGVMIGLQVPSPPFLSPTNSCSADHSLAHGHSVAHQPKK
jgi:hypothetical protein